MNFKLYLLTFSFVLSYAYGNEAQLFDENTQNQIIMTEKALHEDLIDKRKLA